MLLDRALEPRLARQSLESEIVVCLERELRPTVIFSAGRSPYRVPLPFELSFLLHGSLRYLQTMLIGMLYHL